MRDNIDIFFNKGELSQLDQNKERNPISISSNPKGQYKKVQRQLDNCQSKSDVKLMNSGRPLVYLNNKSITQQVKHQKKTFFEEDLDGLDYKDAIEYDKRSFIRIYWCFLKNSQSIIYCFFVFSKKSIKTIKISIFIFGIMMDFMLSAFFYSDAYISKTYKKQGKGNSFVDNLPISFYSYMFGFFINLILNFLSDTESMLEKLDELNTEKEFNIVMKSIVRTIKIKLSFFFVLQFLLIHFFWYYITSFCSVYSNSQDEWFYSGLLSTGMSMAFPFGTSLIFALLRFGGLRLKSCFLLKIISFISIFL